jgi:hypothetical protein
MNALAVAQHLKQQGINVTGTTPASQEEDGCVQLSPRVHVQVQEFSNCINVVRETSDGKFLFMPDRIDYQRLIEDINEALKAEQSEGAAK